MYFSKPGALITLFKICFFLTLSGFDFCHANVVTIRKIVWSCNLRLDFI